MPTFHPWASRFFGLAALLLLVLTAGQRAWGQRVAPTDFRFEHLTVDQGLSHSDAMAIAQDQAGFMWVGTNSGLDRYDGYSLKNYLLPVSPRTLIPSNRIRALHVDGGGRLWAGADRAGLCFYDATADRFFRFDETPLPARLGESSRRMMTASVVAIASDKQGRLWVGTYQAGLFVLTFDKAGQLTDLQQVLAPAPAAATNYVTSLAADPDGSVWVGTANNGLRVVRPGRSLVVAEPTPITQVVRSLCLDRRGDLWIGTDQQVLWLSGTTHRSQALQANARPQTYPSVRTLLLDSFGRLWIGTNNGLYVWDAGSVSNAAPPLLAGPPTLLLPQDDKPFGINASHAQQLFEGRNQELWVCTSAGGLNKVNLRQKPFGQLRRQLTGKPTLPSNFTNAIYLEEHRKLLWLGTGNGLSCYDLVHQTYRNDFGARWASTNRSANVSVIFQSSNSTLWFGSRDRALASLVRRGEQETFTVFDHWPPALGLANARVESIAEDRWGTLWVATFNMGLLHLSQEGKLLGSYRRDNSQLPTDNFTCLAYDQARDVLWASTGNAGLLKLRPTPDSLRVLRQFRGALPRPSRPATQFTVNFLSQLLLDRQGTLWVGTMGGGLHQLTTDAQGRETIRSYAQYLPPRDVESLLADEEGHLWVGGTGLYRFTPATGQYLRYDATDGLQSNAFKTGAACRSADGTLYFGGINGVSYFQPQAVQPNPYPPVVQLIGLRIANEPVAVGKPVHGRVVLAHSLAQRPRVTIEASENDFSVEFVGLNYANPQKNRYAYRLVGYNSSWVYPPPGQRTASFANLPPGQYTFEVKASNGEEVWSKKAATLQFDVRAPWYATGWAYLLYAALAVGAVGLYRRIEMTQQGLKNSLALEQFQKVKEKELTDLKFSFFTNISHELRTPLTLILGPLEELVSSPGAVVGLHDKVELMHQQTRKLLGLVNQLLDFRKVETNNMPLRAAYGDAVPLLAQLHALFQPQAQKHGLKYQLVVPSQPVPLYFDRSKLEIVLTNLLTNAFNYTRQGQVTLAATLVGNPGSAARYTNGQLTDNFLKITVADTGTGIQPGELGHIFEPYYQAAHTHTLRMGGTGIGLALAKQFAERHGGYLTVTSTVDQGTAFELRLPFGHQHLQPGDILEVEEVAALPGETLLPLVNASGLPAAELPLASPPRLLLVEDNAEVLQYLRQLFAPGYEVLLAEDGLAGWNQALQYLPDLIISDVMMPNSDGLELCQRIRQHPKTAHIPVLLLTARTAETYELEGLGMGADEYMSKPFNPMRLRAKAETMLRNRSKLHAYYQRQILLEPTSIVVADADREFLKHAMQAVEKFLSNSELSVPMLAQEMAMSQSLLYRRIKSITGQTMVEFIRDVRMKRAAQLLTQTPMRVAEVAMEVGIEDVKYFRKIFQKIYMLSPSEYAKRHR